MPESASDNNTYKAWLSIVWAWGLRAALLIAGLLIGFGGPYLWRLDREVRAQFAQLQWQIPTRVYARPLILSAGARMTADALLLELQAAGYRDDSDGSLPGSFVRDGQTFHITTRRFRDADGELPSREFILRLANGAVSQLRDKNNRPIQSVTIDPARIATLYGSNQEERQLVRLDEVPELLLTGLQAVEDKNFKYHYGIDPRGLLRAMWVNVREAGVEQGASTLTMQLVRSLFLTREQTYSRKIREALSAIIIEARFDKRRILETYLNQVYLGQRGNQSIHGVGAGAQFWFGRDLSSLRSQEIALLIGMIRGPSYYDPRRFPERAKTRRDLVLSVMQRFELIDGKERERASAAPLGVSSRPTVASNRNPGFLDLVRRQLASDYPADALRGAGLSVLTTLSPSAQQLAEQSVSRTLASIEKKNGPALQASMVLTDTTKGDVLAVVGNRRADQPGFNRALEAQRPVGSLLKPMVYLLALAQPGRWSLATPVDDAPIDIVLPNGKRWQPENSDSRSHGTVSLQEALVQSYNQATVRIGMDVGPERLVELLKVLGGLHAVPNPSLILGSVDLSPFAMTQLYQFLASGGQLQPLRAVRGVLDAQGKQLSRYDSVAEPPQAGDTIAARLVTLALQQAVVRGTGRSLQKDGLGELRAAGKTGTSNDGRDSWFAGYTGDRLAVVWVGNDRNETTGLYGATGALRVWSALFKSLPNEPLRVSEEGLEWAWVHNEEFATTEDDCDGARRYPFVQGFLPETHRRCRERGWLDYFLIGGSEK